MGIKEQLLEKCIGFLIEISKRPADDFFGTPPSVFYIDYGIGTKRKFGFQLTQVEETYQLCKGEVEIVKTGTKPQREPVSGMFYMEGHATIGYDLNEEKAYLDYVVGPRYGRGFVYPIVIFAFFKLDLNAKCAKNR